MNTAKPQNHSFRILIDSTLREGEQAFGYTPSVQNKVELAVVLNRLGCDIIELGHPAVSPSSAEAARAISDRQLRAQGLVHCLLDENDIRNGSRTGARWIGFFLAVAPQFSSARYGNKLPELRRRIPDCIALAKSRGFRIRFTCEDASRTEGGLLHDFYAELHSLGVDLLGYADTTGVLNPFDSARIFLDLRRGFPDAAFHFHGHNDRGLALANALMALDCGWNSVDASLFGLGERAGIVPLRECALLLQERFRMSFDLRWMKTAEEIVLRDLDWSRYLRGRFAHKAGLHCHAVDVQPESYESLAPKTMGESRTRVFSKFLGKKSMRNLLQSIPEANSEGHAEWICERMKEQDVEFSDPQTIGRILRTLAKNV